MRAEAEMELEKIKGIIAGILNIDPDTVNEDSAFIEDLGADSLDVFQIIMGVEDEFDIEISPVEAERISTVGEAVELVRGAVR
jgi:acyl carrier protein